MIQESKYSLGESTIVVPHDTDVGIENQHFILTAIVQTAKGRDQFSNSSESVENARFG